MNAATSSTTPLETELISAVPEATAAVKPPEGASPSETTRRGPSLGERLGKMGRGAVAGSVSWWVGYQPWRRRFLAIFRREFTGYFRTPIAYVFLAAVLVVLNGVTWSRFGGFFEAEDASLRVLFQILPWVFLMLMPALGMRLWAEERRSGTAELLFTYPVSRLQAVLAKFAAAWLFALIALVLTFPMVITVHLLGQPDSGAILGSYLGAAYLAGAFLALCSFASALTQNQVIAFVLGLVFGIGFLLIGLEATNDFFFALGLPVAVVDGIVNLGFLPHLEPMSKGLILLRDVVYFKALMVAGLAATVFRLSPR